jgi:PIN domain nuclease of toxin-antitoxin system
MIVVDTHAVVWLTQQQELLSEAAIAALAEERRHGQMAIADITLREIAVHVARGRVAISSPPEVYLRFIESLFVVLPVTAAIAERSTRFGTSYPKDPADQLIGATAIVHGAGLITKDDAIRASGEVDCIW